MPDGSPVSRIATRSARGAVRPARVGNTPGYRTGNSLANSGCCTYFRNALSSAGRSRFQRSFSPSGTMTSLNSGLPRRETWIHGPDSEPALVLSIIRTLRRLAALHTPMTDDFAFGSFGAEPAAVSSGIGI